LDLLGWFGGLGGVLGGLIVMDLPVAGLRLNANNTIEAITVIKINGIEIINHETIPNPELHNMFNNSVNMTPIHISITAVLYNPL